MGRTDADVDAPAPEPDDADLDELGDRREATIREYRALLERLRVRAERGEADAERYLRAVEQVSVDELTHADLVMVGRRLRQPISTADSLFRSIVTRRRMKQLGEVPERLLGISKDLDRLFAEALDLRIPDVRFTGLLADVPDDVRVGTVLKPLRSSGSRGVYWLFDRDRIRSVEHGTTYTDWGSMVAAIEDELGADFAGEQHWEVQELISEDHESTPARDLKFYAFYGEIGAILEVVRHPTWQYQFFGPDLRKIESGRDHEPPFVDPSQTITDRGGLRDEEIAAVRKLSRQMPVPFMRIDFLRGVDGLVFAEMSSAPGSSHTWNTEFDRRLGRMYHEAQLRLVDDLLDGKRFTRYRRFRQLHREVGTGTGVASAGTGRLDRRALDAETSLRGRSTRPLRLTPREISDWERTLERTDLDELLGDRATSLERSRHLVEFLRLRARRSDDDAGRYLRALDALSVDELTHPDVATAARGLRADLTTADSFFAAIVVRRRKRQLGPIPERRLGQSRDLDQRFARELGVRTPALRYEGPLRDLPAGCRTGVVLRPGGAARPAVELRMPADDEIREVRTRTTVGSWDEAVALVVDELGPSALDDDWVAHELVLDAGSAPAPELRCWCFYGRIGLLEEVAGDGSNRREFFDPDRTVAPCGRDHEARLPRSATITDRGGIDDAGLEAVAAMSAELPVPFMRIDHLLGGDGPVFHAFSSAPGMAHTFSDEYDRRLGRLYHEAEVRLTDDLLAGREFAAYHRFLEALRQGT